jgi:hypothetical protein
VSAISSIRVFPLVGLILITAIGLLRAFPSNLRWLHVACWIGLVATLAYSLLSNSRTSRQENGLTIAAIAIATLLIVRFGIYECWSFFATLCSKSWPPVATWDMVFVNHDTFMYLEQFGSNSLRPPLYGWFAWAANFFLITPNDLINEASNLLAFVADPQANAAYLKGHPQPHVLQIVQAQQIALWASAIFFVWCASRIVPVLAVAPVILALYDGGVLTQGYLAHAAEAKMLYLAAFFAAAAATLLTVARPSRRNLLLGAIFCAALPLLRPQGLVAGLLVAFACLRFLWAQPRISGWAVRASAGAFAIFIAAAALPSIVTFMGQKVLQPSNIYALSRIAFALEVATPGDVEHLPDGFTKQYLTRMLAMRDNGGRPNDVNDAVRRGGGLAVDACLESKQGQTQGLLCGNAMNTIADVVLERHYSEYLHKLVLPALATLMRVHIGGSIAYLPTSLALTVALVATLLFIAPWLALWGASIFAVHASLILLLAMLAGPYSEYFITTEPVLLSAMAVMLAFAIQEFVGPRIGSGEATAYPQSSAIGLLAGLAEYSAAHEHKAEISSTDDNAEETEEPELSKQPRGTALQSLGLFAAKVAIVVAAIVIGTLFVVSAISQRIQTATGSIHVGGRQFWSKLGQELERQAGPDTDLTPEQRERLLRNLRVIVQRWRPFIDVLKEESQSSAEKIDSAKPNTPPRSNP